jgi:hypothetical protein
MWDVGGIRWRGSAELKIPRLGVAVDACSPRIGERQTLSHLMSHAHYRTVSHPTSRNHWAIIRPKHR